MRGQPVLFKNFTGGVNYESAPYNLQDSGQIEARDALNVVATVRGAIRKRGGSTQFAAPAAEIRSLYAGQAGNVMLAASSTVVYKIDTGGVVTSLLTGQTNGSWEWVRAPINTGEGPYFGSNGVDAPRYFNGSGTTTGLWTAISGTGLYSVVPRGKFMAYLGNRLFVGGVTTDPGTGLLDVGSTLFYSDIGNVRNWPTTNVVQFDPGDGESISGIGTYGPYILVFKPSKAWVVYDTETGANRRLADNIGCVAHRSIVESPHGTFFLSEDQGVMTTNGSRIERVSDKVLPHLQGIVAANRSLATAAYFNNHYYLSFSRSGAANSTMLDYDVQLGSWWVHSHGVNDLAVWEATSGNPLLYGARAGASRVDRLFDDATNQDAGSNFTAYWKGPYHVFGSPFLRKRVRQIHFDGSGRIQVSLSRDFAFGESLARDANFLEESGTFGGTGSFGGTGTFGSTLAVNEARVYTPGVARAWSIVVGNATNEDFEVDSYTFALTQRRN